MSGAGAELVVLRYEMAPGLLWVRYLFFIMYTLDLVYTIDKGQVEVTTFSVMNTMMYVL